MIRFLVALALAATSAPNAFAFDTQSHFWDLTYIEGFEGPLETAIPVGYVAYGGAQNLSLPKLHTAYDPQTKTIIGVSFSGCNGVSNTKFATFENDWAGVIVRPACTLLLEKVQALNVGRIVERIATVAHESDDLFLALTPRFADLIVDWPTKSLRYVDASGETLVSFKLREAAE